MGRSVILFAFAATLVALDAAPAEAQINTRRIRERAEQTARDRTERRVDQGVDRAVDAAEGAVVCAVSDQSCIQKAKAEGKTPVDQSGQPIEASQPAAPVSGSQENSAAAGVGEGAFVNFDFVPGERTLYFEDFTRDNVGDFPRRLEFGSGNMEVAEWQGRRFLRSTERGQLAIPLPEVLPVRFTVEFEHVGNEGSFPHLTMRFDGRDDDKREHDRIVIQTYVGRNRMAGGVYAPSYSPRSRGEVGLQTRQIVPVRVMVDGGYAKVYMAGTRVANIPNANLGRSNRIIIEWGARAEEPGLIGPIRVAAGGRKLYDAIAEKGRVATQGIYFDTGSDRIRPESGPTLKEIADMMREHGDLRLTIEGHTDNVGNAQANQQLSERRAAAVREALVSQHGVDGSRLQSAGLGATKPAAGNDTPEGRQTNRRVELVRR